VCAGASRLQQVAAMIGVRTCFPAHNRSLAVGVDGGLLVSPHAYLLFVAVRARASRFRHVSATSGLDTYFSGRSRSFAASACRGAVLWRRDSTTRASLCAPVRLGCYAL